MKCGELVFKSVKSIKGHGHNQGKVMHIKQGTKLRK